MVDKRKDQGMSREAAGQKGGEATSATHGKEFYEDIGHKGGQESSGNFANDPERASEAGKKGGDATADSHSQEFYEDIGHKGGQESGGNFANDPKRASEAGKKGGKNSHGGNG